MSSLFGIGGGGNVGASSSFYSYPINQSLRFNDNDSPYLVRTVTTTGNRKTWTFSCWLKGASFAGSNVIWATSQLYDTLRYTSTGKFMLLLGNTSANLQTTAVFRDPSAWYNLVLAVDTTQSTSTDRVKFYVNGSQITSFSTASYPSLNYDTGYNHTSYTNAIGRRESTSNLYWDCYLAEINMIDGTALTADSFGETVEGIWTPKNTSGLTFGTNGFKLDFANSGDIGNDVSGNNNDWTPSGLAATDVVPDSPTNNFAVMNSLVTRGDVAEKTVFSEGNLKVQGQTSGTATQVSQGTMEFPATGKYYFEVLVVSSDSSSAWHIGIGSNYSNSGIVSDSDVYYREDGQKRIDGTNSAYGASYTAGDIIGVSVNLDDDEVEFFKNNSSQGVISHTLSGDFIPMFLVPPTADQAIANFGQDSTFSGATTAGGNQDANGIGDFKYAPPSGYLALCTANLPTPTIVDGTEHFNTLLWTGDGSNPRTLSGLDFAADFIWHKSRSSASMDNHAIQDVVRGFNTNNNLYLFDAAETTYQNRGVINSVSSTGFTFNQNASDYSTADGLNQNNSTFVAWNWLAGTAFSNDASATGVGTIDSTGQVNTKAGFSIVSWTGTGSAGTIAHGISKPELIIVKNRDQADKWVVYHEGQNANPATGYVSLNETSAFGASSSVWNDTAPTSTVFSVGTGGSVNALSEKYISYIFHSVEGYSKVGSYTGNGSTSSPPFVFTGFRPAWIMIKCSSSNSTNWLLLDNKREGYNSAQDVLFAESSAAEETNAAKTVDFLSNGFKVAATANVSTNANSGTYIYLAFAENPFKYANAR